MIKIDTFPKLLLVLLSILGVVVGFITYSTPSCELIENTCAGTVLQEEIIPESQRAQWEASSVVSEYSVSEPNIPSPEPTTASAFQISQDIKILTQAKNHIYFLYKEQNKLPEFYALSIEDAMRQYPQFFTHFKNSFPNGYLGNGMVKSKPLSDIECETFNYAMLDSVGIQYDMELMNAVSSGVDRLRTSRFSALCLSDGYVYYKLN